ncbi:MAG: potassium channel family protein [Candidatus Methanomethylicaceae archaeon]
MKILIVGGGPVTQELLKAFDAERELKRNEVMVVELDPETAEELSKSFDVVVIRGDARDISLYETQISSLVPINEFDAVLALTDREEVNVFALTLARHYGSAVRLARVRNVRVGEVISKLDLGTPIIVPTIVSNFIKTYLQTLLQPKLLGEVDEYKIYCLTVSGTDKVVNKRIEELQLPEDTKILFIFDGMRLHIPSKEEVIKEGQLLYILTKTSDINVITEVFKG